MDSGSQRLGVANGNEASFEDAVLMINGGEKRKGRDK
jgi:hypothetical protein